MTLTDLFTYELPPERIAQEPIEPRDSSRLMVLDHNSEELKDDRFNNVINYLNDGDCLVYNDSRVIPARLVGRKEPSGATVEVLLLTEEEDDHWTALIKPSRRVKPGMFITFEKDRFWAYVDDKIGFGEWLIRLESEGRVWEALKRVGRVPLPPYIKKELERPERYQTVYAKEPGSAAAPTAGLHFTSALIDRLRSNGVDFVPVTLHIGLDTFKPIREEHVEDHSIHSEYFELKAEAVDRIRVAKENGKRVIAVGTTAARVLESAVDEKGQTVPARGKTSLFIKPGHLFRVIDGMVTNFHLPRSTLLVMVCTFAGRERVLSAYEHAKKFNYRFYSFGDAMLILK